MAKEKQDQKPEQAAKAGSYVCHTPCFFDGKLYAVGDKYESDKQPPKHFQPADKPLPPEQDIINPKKVRKVHPVVDFEKGLNGVEQ